MFEVLLVIASIGIAIFLGYYLCKWYKETKKAGLIHTEYKEDEDNE